MSLGKHLGFATLVISLLGAVSCSGGGSSSGANSITAALQDLDLDATGQTTVITFDSTKGLAGATVANFETDGAQSATSVVIAGDEVTIEWDARVTPSDEVRVTGLSGVDTVFHAVTTSDDDAPTFTASAIQNAGLGGDVVEVEFSGPNVVEDTAEDAAHWTVAVDGTTLDLTGSTFDFDEGTQTLTITLGTLANVHATFTIQASDVLSVADVDADTSEVAGTATGDTTAPSLVSAEQNLTEDEFGRVVDFTFDKAMSPVFATNLSQFGALPDVAVSVEQPSEDVLRVTFNGPVIPGVQQVTLTDIVDLHGNAFADGAQAIAQGSAVVNAYDGTPAAVTVPNADNDYVEILTTQAFDPESAEDVTNWTLDIGGNPVDLSALTFTYDLLTKTLTIPLEQDFANGQAFTITGVGVLDVDGDAFNLADSGTVGGDAAGPTVTSVTQNRTLDASGATLDVLLTEDVEETTAETTGNWILSGAQNLLSATLLGSGDTVRLVYDAAVIPGDYTLDVAAIDDIAGNAMPAGQSALAIVGDDTTAPDLTSLAAEAVEGIENDTVSVVFDDDMIESEVELVANWTVESPVGAAIDTTGATIVYDTFTKTATMTLANAVNLHLGDDVAVELATARDLGGNTVLATQLEDDIVAETNLPTVDTIYRSSAFPNIVVVRFSEPCTQLDDIFDAGTNPTGTRYVLRDNVGTIRTGMPTPTVVNDGLGVELAFGVVVNATDTLDILGVEDACGNPCFPALAVPTIAEDFGTPSLAIGSSTFTSVSGSRNDLITIVFDRPLSAWNLLVPQNFTITTGATTLDLSNSTFAFDGNDTVTIQLTNSTGNDLQTGGLYDIAVNGVFSAQGVQRVVDDMETNVVCAGDSSAPSVAVGKVRVDPQVADSLLVEIDEDADLASAETAANYDLNGGTLATSASLITSRTVRVTFGVQPVPGDTLAITVADLAGNSSGVIVRAVTTSDASAPLISSVAGVIRTGVGGDRVVVTFSEPLDLVTALDPANYGVLSGVTTISLVNSQFVYDGNTNAVTILLASSQALIAGAALTVTVSNVEDVSGNAMGTGVQLVGATTGDTTAPDFSEAFVNLRADDLGREVDVRFDEDVKTTFVTTPGSWTVSGGVTVTAVELLSNQHFRLTLSAALGSSSTLALTGVNDIAGNVSGAITIDPVE
jgi:hypothetical protein